MCPTVAIAVDADGRLVGSPCRCRRFVLCELDNGQLRGMRWLSLAEHEALDAHSPWPAALTEIDCLIGGEADAALAGRFDRRGIEWRPTAERDPVRLLDCLRRGEMPPTSARPAPVRRSARHHYH